MAVAKEVKKTKVIVQSIDKEPEVFVAVNGETFLIKCGEPVEITDSVIDVLKNAVEVRTQVNVTEDGIKVSKQVPERKYLIEVA